MKFKGKGEKVEFLAGMLATVFPEEGDIHMSRRGDVLTVEVGEVSVVGSVREVKAQVLGELGSFGDVVASMEVGGVKKTLTKKELQDLVVKG